MSDAPPGDEAPATSSMREVEAKFRVHPPFVIPRLTGDRTGAASVDQATETELRATYWDTSDLRLAREGVTLRHRSGEGADKDGWHLKLPIREGRVPDASIGARDEIHADGDDGEIPAVLRDLVSPWVRTVVLGQVATLVTKRTSYLLRTADGTPIVELTDDLVSVLSSGHVAGRFREIEVEDRGGGAEAIETVGGVLRAGGAVGGEFLPKVVRALGPQATAEPDPPPPGEVGPDDPARVAFRDVLRRNVRALIGYDVAVRRQQPDAVHQMRVTARRLRGALKTYGPLLDPEWADSLRAEIKWLADTLAGARDNEVLLARLTERLAGVPEDLVIGPVQARLDEVLGGKLAAGSEHVIETLRSERYLVLLERLVDGAWEPLTAPAAEEPVSVVIPPLVEKAWQRVAKGVKGLSAPEATDHDWHQVRIKAKQLRYACDAVVPVFGKPAKALSKQAEAIQEVLGEHQDAVVAADTLRDMAADGVAPDAAFTLGILHAYETKAADAAREEFAPVWAEAQHSKYRKWLAT